MAQAAKKKIFDDRYEVLSIVGRGSRSVVYHARHIKNPNTEVALKVLLEQKGRLSNPERLRKEALALVSARHRSVIRLDDFHSVGSLCYLSLEYAPEADLRRYTKKIGGVLPVEFAERFLVQMAEALAFVHKVGIIHRDVKPENILIVNQQEARLADFGVAVLPGDSASLEDLQSGIGTMNYLAPEVLDGKPADARSDLYSLAVTFYELLTGLNPFEKASLAQQVDARRDENVPRILTLAPAVPVYLAEALMQAMRFDPAARFSSVREFLQALLVGKSSPTEAASPAPRERPARSRRASASALHRAADDQAPEKTAAVRADIAVDSLESSIPTSPRATETSSVTSDTPTSGEISIKDEPEDAEQATQPMPQFEPPPTPVKQASEEVGQTMVVTTPPPEPKNSPGITETVYAPGGISSLLGKSKSDSLESQSSTATTEVPSEVAATVTIPRDKAVPASSAPSPSGASTSAPVDDPTQTTFISPHSVDEAKRAGIERIRERQRQRAAKKSPPPSVHGGSPKGASASGDIPVHPRMNLKKLALLGAGVGITFAIVAGIISGVISAFSPASEEPTTQAAFTPPIPPVTTEDYVFPQLPPGLYVGSISDLLPGRKVPLTLISIERPASDGVDQSGAVPMTDVSVVVGIDGWSPAVGSARASASSAQGPILLRVTSNGYILELAAQTVYGELYGTYRNLVTGSHGEWKVRPVTVSTASGDKSPS